MSAELLKKLKLSDNSELVVLNDESASYFKEEATARELSDKAVEHIMLFVKTKEELQAEVFKLIEKEALALNGRLFIAYPKKGNKKINSFVSRDDIFPALKMDEERYVGDSDYKFNQLLSLDETYSLMTLKRVDKKKTKKIDKSGCVSEYEHLIPELEQALLPHREAHDFFMTLTPGYKKSWARHVYSAKQEVTRQKRLDETILLLTDKVKTKK